MHNYHGLTGKNKKKNALYRATLKRKCCSAGEDKEENKQSINKKRSETAHLIGQLLFGLKEHFQSADWTLGGGFCLHVCVGSLQVKLR